MLHRSTIEKVHPKRNFQINVARVYTCGLIEGLIHGSPWWKVSRLITGEVTEHNPILRCHIRASQPAVRRDYWRFQPRRQQPAPDGQLATSRLSINDSLAEDVGISPATLFHTLPSPAYFLFFIFFWGSTVYEAMRIFLKNRLLKLDYGANSTATNACVALWRNFLDLVKLIVCTRRRNILEVELRQGFRKVCSNREWTVVGDLSQECGSQLDKKSILGASRNQSENRLARLLCGVARLKHRKQSSLGAVHGKVSNFESPAPDLHVFTLYNLPHYGKLSLPRALSLCSCLGQCSLYREQPLTRYLVESEGTWAVLDIEVLRAEEGETGDPRENPPTSGIVRHDSHMRKSGVTRLGFKPDRLGGRRADLPLSHQDTFLFDWGPIVIKYSDTERPGFAGRHSRQGTFKTTQPRKWYFGVQLVLEYFREKHLRTQPPIGCRDDLDVGLKSDWLLRAAEYFLLANLPADSQPSPGALGGGATARQSRRDLATARHAAGTADVTRSSCGPPGSSTTDFVVELAVTGVSPRRQCARTRLPRRRRRGPISLAYTVSVKDRLCAPRESLHLLVLHNFFFLFSNKSVKCTYELGTGSKCVSGPSPMYLQELRSRKKACIAAGMYCAAMANYASEPGSIPGGVTRGLSRVGIVPDDATGRRVFSAVSSFPSTAAPCSLRLTLIGSQDFTVKSRPNLFTRSRNWRGDLTNGSRVSLATAYCENYPTCCAVGWEVGNQALTGELRYDSLLTKYIFLACAAKTSASTTPGLEPGRGLESAVAASHAVLLWPVSLAAPRAEASRRSVERNFPLTDSARSPRSGSEHMCANSSGEFARSTGNAVRLRAATPRDVSHRKHPSSRRECAPVDRFRALSRSAICFTPAPKTRLCVNGASEVPAGFEFNYLQARLCIFMYKYADIDCTLGVCCHSERRPSGQRSPGGVKHRVDQWLKLYKHICLEFQNASKRIREFLRSLHITVAEHRAYSSLALPTKEVLCRLKYSTHHKMSRLQHLKPSISCVGLCISAYHRPIGPGYTGHAYSTIQRLLLAGHRPMKPRVDCVPINASRQMAVFRTWESCRTMPRFSLGHLPFLPLLHSGTAPSSLHLSLIGSQDLDVKSRPNFSTPLPRALRSQSENGHPDPEYTTVHMTFGKFIFSGNCTPEVLISTIKVQFGLLVTLTLNCYYWLKESFTSCHKYSQPLRAVSSTHHVARYYVTVACSELLQGKLVLAHACAFSVHAAGNNNHCGVQRDWMYVDQSDLKCRTTF
ncbi:hypothetical protein PR048_003474 [Dryococelus australis]|uniref:Uncharacterized protein n=1 Tax=Dryococelus australis TaxID=614101 RepID=A0ABQ9IN84_9NEOP|nr:hypothetical protein PR048_003474 [Dryococelus australis]